MDVYNYDIEICIHSYGELKRHLMRVQLYLCHKFENSETGASEGVKYWGGQRFKLRGVSAKIHPCRGAGLALAMHFGVPCKPAFASEQNIPVDSRHVNR